MSLTGRPVVVRAIDIQYATCSYTVQCWSAVEYLSKYSSMGKHAACGTTVDVMIVN